MNWLALPLLIPLLTACACLLRGHVASWQRGCALVGGILQLVATGVLLAAVWQGETRVLYVGGWEAPLGITLVADVFASLMTFVAAVLHMAVTIYSFATIDARRQRYGYFALLSVMLMGVSGAFLTGDLFNLYVWFEVMLISSFVLLVLGGDRAQMHAGLKYVTLSLLSSAVFLAAVGIIYGTAHTLNLADLSQRLAEASQTHPWLITSASALLLIAFGVKAAVFPLHFWLPDSYAAPPPAVTAIFAALLTKVGVYAMVRLFAQVLPPSNYLLTIIAIIAGLTMVVGVLGAVSQMHMRRILNVHIVSQIGYMVMGVALLAAPDAATRQLAIAAVIVYIIHNMLVKTNLLLISGTVRGLAGSESLKQLGGLVTRTPLVAGIFLITALSLAGLPPSSGFWAKLGIIQAGFHAGAYLLTATAIGVGLLTLLSMVKIWSEVFWKPAPEQGPAASPPLSRGRRAMLIGPTIVLVVLTMLIGLYPQPLLSAADRAAAELLDRSAYQATVGLAAAETSDAGAPS